MVLVSILNMKFLIGAVLLLFMAVVLIVGGLLLTDLNPRSIVFGAIAALLLCLKNLYDMELRFRLIFALKSQSTEKQQLLSHEKQSNEKRLTSIVPKYLITKFKAHSQEIVERIPNVTIMVVKILNLEKLDLPALKILEIVNMINSKSESLLEGTTIQFLHNTTSTLIVSTPLY